MNATLLRRLRTYQAERFPLLAYTPLFAVATFAAVAFSWGARWGWATGKFPLGPWAVGLFTVLVLFFFLRVLDEHKDAEQDARYRPELPVPRGLVSLRELRAVALLTLAAALALNALVDPALLVVLAVVLAWAGFMGREFFIPDWLRARPAWYLVSHMLVMPLIFLYATALDWLAAGASPPPGLAAFLALAFCNGLVIEVGRKLHPADEEREGVDSYTQAWGRGVAGAVWIVAVLAAAASALLTARAITGAEADFGVLGVPTAAALNLVVLAVAVVVPGLLLARGSPRVRSAHIAGAAGVWVLVSYGVVGAVGWAAGSFG
jgi:hypothetical protein